MNSELDYTLPHIKDNAKAVTVQLVGYKANKSKILKIEDIRKFLLDAPDNIYLMWKVVLIFGVSGACRCTELAKITIDDIVDNGSTLIVEIPNSKTGIKRTFIVSNEEDEHVDYLQYYRKYAALRSKHEKTRRFFLGYKNGKCMSRVVGINLFGNIPAQIAAFLNLPDSASYTSHCFRTSSTSTNFTECTEEPNLTGIQLNQVCRTCLANSENMKSLYEASSTSTQISFAEMLMKSTPLKYVENDGLPTQICRNCINNLNISYTFQLKCLESDTTLRKGIKKNTITKMSRIISESILEASATPETPETQIKPIQSSNITLNHTYLPLTNDATQNELRQELQFVNVDIETEADMDPMNKQIYVPGKPLNTPLTFAELEKDLGQELDLIKHETDLEVTIELEDNTVNQGKIVASQSSDITVNNAYLPLTNVATQKELQLGNVNIKMEAVMDPMNECVKQIYVPGKSLNTRLTFAELEKDLSQDLVLIKDEVNLGIKIELEDNSEMQPAKIVKIPEIHSESLSETYNCSIEDNTNVKLDLETFSNTKMDKTLTLNTNLADNTKRKSYSCTNLMVQKLYACTFCNSSFTKKIHLIVHKRQMHSAEKPYSCTVCSKCFSEKYYLARHMRTHSRQNRAKSYVCTICNNTFNRKQNLTRHHTRIHSGEKPYLCTVCKKQFSENAMLTRHMQSHTAEKPYSCTVCSKSFKSKWNLKIHMQYHTEPLYTCTICNSSLATKRSYARHMRAHNGEKPYSCTVCEKQFRENACLTRHMRTHLRERSYSCTVCDSSFNRKYLLRSHMRLHPVQKSFLCTVCNVAFTVKGNLDRHMRRHSGEKPYSCTRCNSTFGYSHNLARHVQKHRGEGPYSCTVCSIRFNDKSTLRNHTRTHLRKSLGV